MHGGLRRFDDALHGVGVTADRPHLGQSRYLGGHVEELADPAGRRGVHDHRVVVEPAAAPAPGGLHGLAGQQHVPQARGDRGGEVDHAQAGQGGPGVPEVVEHLQVLDQGRLGIGRQRVDLPAGQGRRGRGHRDPPLRVGQRRGVEEPGDALASLDFHEQHPAAAGRERDGQCPGYRRLACPALAGDDVQPDAFPIRVPRPHPKQAIVARPPHPPRGQPGGSGLAGSGGSGPFTGGRPVCH